MRSSVIKPFSANSIQGYVTRVMMLLSGLIVTLSGILMINFQLPSLLVMSILLLTGVGLLTVSFRLKSRICQEFDRAVMHLDAIKMENFSLYARSSFAQGSSVELHQSLKSFSQDLQQLKSRYAQHAYLLYQLIDQLDTPVMVFNQNQQLTYANNAFALLYQQPWQDFRLASPESLSLRKVDNGWQLTKQNHKWQVSQSEFIDQGQQHQLFVFTNVGSVIRSSQLEAWQQIIRVLSHEIRNSLTPVSSLAESLSDKLTTEREQTALRVIAERCHQLQDFVQRYASLSNTLELKIQPVATKQLIERVQNLFPHQQITVVNQVEYLRVDRTFFEQVLINLIKNAFEAGATKVILEFQPKFINQQHKCNEITLVDNGEGFANTDNIFVPLFTTKNKGQGIGLSLCRNIIEQHQGELSLFNNKPHAMQDEQFKTGVTAIIQLPV